MAGGLQELEDNRKGALAKVASAGVLDLLTQSPWRSLVKVIHRVQV